MNLFNRQDSASREERQPEVPRVQIQGEEAVIPSTDGDDRVKLPPKVWG